ncbi:hypothetical protein GWC95_16765 [Sediminibacterium roseum]|uniref:Tissue inhibitor of metalloproteinase n=1 Tax=Sediminibacterium roseum TaxID=1978412 RepID=A0ABW9ZWQ5_9BACT|nr:hypothetical protein [Sediminibacterium roseum]NCI51584.1 hypothetical protein [Sediminibacterium roseum]
MARLIIILFCLSSCLTGANGQSKIPVDACGFLAHPKFRNGRDTISIKVVCKEVGPPVLEKYILRKIRLREKDFGYSLFFTPVNCNKTYGIPSSDKSKEALAVFSEESVGRIFTIRCIVFKDLEVDGRPFFVIDRIRASK